MPTLEEEIREAVELGITVVDLRRRGAEGRVSSGPTGQAWIDRQPTPAEIAGMGLVAGRIRDEEMAPPKKPKRSRPTLVEAAFSWPGTWTIPLCVTPGDNARGVRSRIGKAGHERKICTREFAKWHDAWAFWVTHLGPAQHGRSVKITLTRLGGRGLDRINVEAAMKYVADTVAAWLGVDDNDPRLIWGPCQQEPGGPSGVRVTISKA